MANIFRVDLAGGKHRYCELNLPATDYELLDALDHPEKHENLVVRIGGFSEYFNRLSPTLKQSVIDRAEY